MKLKELLQPMIEANLLPNGYNIYIYREGTSWRSYYDDPIDRLINDRLMNDSENPDSYFVMNNGNGQSISKEKVENSEVHLVSSDPLGDDAIAFFITISC